MEAFRKTPSRISFKDTVPETFRTPSRPLLNLSESPSGRPSAKPPSKTPSEPPSFENPFGTTLLRRPSSRRAEAPFRSLSESAACPETPFGAVPKPCQMPFSKLRRNLLRKPSEYDTYPESQPGSLLRNRPFRTPFGNTFGTCHLSPSAP